MSFDQMVELVHLKLILSLKTFVDYRMGQVVKAHKKADESCLDKLGAQIGPRELEKNIKVGAWPTVTWQKDEATYPGHL